MEKCILYIVAGFGIVLTPGCYSEYGVIRQHRVVYTTHIPDVYVQRPYRYRRANWRFWKPRKARAIRNRPTRQHKRVYKRNVYNKTTINRHYYRNNSTKNKRGKKGKNKKY